MNMSIFCHYFRLKTKESIKIFRIKNFSMKRFLTLLLMFTFLWNFLTGCTKRVYTGADLRLIPVDYWAILEKDSPSWGRYYLKDHQIFWKAKVDRRVEGAEATTFSPNARYSDFAKDNKHFYYFGVPLQVDASTFQLLGLAHSKDKNGVYYGVHKLPDADPKTFKVVERYVEGQTPYGKDKNNVYYQWKKIPNADPKTFDFQNDKGQGPFIGNDEMIGGESL